MNFLESLFQNFPKKASITDLPAWRWNRWAGRMRISKQRSVEDPTDNFDREKYFDKDVRDKRFAEMRARNSGTVRYSTVQGRSSLWIVAWPRS